jgi:hypothetical protein
VQFHSDWLAAIRCEQDEEPSPLGQLSGKTLQDADHAEKHQKPRQHEGRVHVGAGVTKTEATDRLASGRIARYVSAKKGVSRAQKAQGEPTSSEQGGTNDSSEREQPRRFHIPFSNGAA